MIDKTLLEKAQERVRKRTDEAKKAADVPAIPKPRTVSEVSVERLAERELEAIAPHTGYPELTRILRGFIPGRLYTLTGNENVGKTSLACNFAVRVAKQGKKVLYIALEPDNMVIEYIASVRTDKPFNDVTDLDRAVDDGNIFIYGKKEVPDLETLVRIVEHSERYDLIVIDHIGYFTSSSGAWVQDQSSAIKRLAGLAKSKRCAIMMIAHLRKKSTGQKKDYIPTSDDISGSGAFKQDSTDVMIVVRQLVDPKAGGMEYSGVGTLYVTKTKSGPNGAMELMFVDGKANITSPAETLLVVAQKEGWSSVGKHSITEIEQAKAEDDNFKW